MRSQAQEWVVNDDRRGAQGRPDELRDGGRAVKKNRLMADVPTPCCCRARWTRPRHLHRREARRGGPGRRSRRAASWNSSSPSASRARLTSSPPRRWRSQLGTIHHEIHFTPEEALDALPDIKCTTSRRSSRFARRCRCTCSRRRIKSMGFKMVLSGEALRTSCSAGTTLLPQGALQGGVPQGVRAQNDPTAPGDVLRANKSTMAWGIEGAAVSSQECATTP